MNVDPSNTVCTATLANINRVKKNTSFQIYRRSRNFSGFYSISNVSIIQCVNDLFTNDILEPNCVFASPRLDPAVGHHRSMQETPTDFILSPPRIPELWCRVNPDPL